MNSGVVSSRYAEALLKYSMELGTVGQLAAQVREILKDPASVGVDSMLPELKRFIALLSSNGREDCLKTSLLSFLDKYYAASGTKIARIRTAVNVPGLDRRLSSYIETTQNCKAFVEAETDPSIVGGFTLEIDGMLLDASVARQLYILKKEFIETNKRLV